MKNRRTFLSLFVLASLAFVGVGYAALTRQLDATTNLKADANTNNLAVQFHPDIMGYKIQTGDAAKIKVGVEPVLNNAQSAAVTIEGISGYEDTVEVYLLVVNNSEPSNNLHATLTAPTITVTHGTTNETSVDNDSKSEVFKGNHFEIEAEYVYATELSLNSSTGEKTFTYAEMGSNVTVGEETVPYLETKTGEDGSVGDGVWLKITYKLINVVTDTFDVHKVTVSFAANSTTDLTPVVSE